MFQRKHAQESTAHVNDWAKRAITLRKRAFKRSCNQQLLRSAQSLKPNARSPLVPFQSYMRNMAGAAACGDSFAPDVYRARVAVTATTRIANQVSRQMCAPHMQTLFQDYQMIFSGKEKLPPAHSQGGHCAAFQKVVAIVSDKILSANRIASFESNAKLRLYCDTASMTMPLKR